MKKVCVWRWLFSGFVWGFLGFFCFLIWMSPSLVWHSSAARPLAPVRACMHTDLSNRRLQSCWGWWLSPKSVFAKLRPVAMRSLWMWKSLFSGSTCIGQRTPWFMYHLPLGLALKGCAEWSKEVSALTDGGQRGGTARWWEEGGTGVGFEWPMLLWHCVLHPMDGCAWLAACDVK